MTNYHAKLTATLIMFSYFSSVSHLCLYSTRCLFWSIPGLATQQISNYVYNWIFGDCFHHDYFDTTASMTIICCLVTFHPLCIWGIIWIPKKFTGKYFFSKTTYPRRMACYYILDLDFGGKKQKKMNNIQCVPFQITTLHCNSYFIN